jgi:hypothetical protein
MIGQGKAGLGWAGYVNEKLQERFMKVSWGVPSGVS